MAEEVTAAHGKNRLSNLYLSVIKKSAAQPGPRVLPHITALAAKDVILVQDWCQDTQDISSPRITHAAEGMGGDFVSCAPLPESYIQAQGVKPGGSPPQNPYWWMYHNEEAYHSGVWESLVTIPAEAEMAAIIVIFPRIRCN